MATLGKVLTIPGNPTLPYGYVSNVRPDGTLGERELTMHSDWSWWQWPLDGISLAAVEVSDAVSSTRFTDNIAAWNDLDETVRERVVGLQARHVINTSPNGQNRTQEPDPAQRQAVHPVVAETPAGDRYLYVNQTATHSIEGMPLSDSAALLQLLFDEMYRPEHLYEHEWRSGDVVVWNNRTMQHARGATSPEHPRTLSRVVIGENSLYEMEPEMRGQHLTKKS